MRLRFAVRWAAGLALAAGPALVGNLVVHLAVGLALVAGPASVGDLGVDRNLASAVSSPWQRSPDRDTRVRGEP